MESQRKWSYPINYSRGCTRFTRPLPGVLLLSSNFANQSSQNKVPIIPELQNPHPLPPHRIIFILGQASRPICLHLLSSPTVLFIETKNKSNNPDLGDLTKGNNGGLKSSPPESNSSPKSCFCNSFATCKFFCY